MRRINCDWKSGKFIDIGAKEALRQVFSNLDEEEHFNRYWRPED